MTSYDKDKIDYMNIMMVKLMVTRIVADDHHSEKCGDMEMEIHMPVVRCGSSSKHDLPLMRHRPLIQK